MRSYACSSSYTKRLSSAFAGAATRRTGQHRELRWGAHMSLHGRTVARRVPRAPMSHGLAPALDRCSPPRAIQKGEVEYRWSRMFFRRRWRSASSPCPLIAQKRWATLVCACGDREDQAWIVFARQGASLESLCPYNVRDDVVGRVWDNVVQEA